MFKITKPSVGKQWVKKVFFPLGSYLVTLQKAVGQDALKT